MMGNNRASHWIRPNHQNRIPKRWIAFDTESKSETTGSVETQTWAMGAAIRWRYGLKNGDQAEPALFDSPETLLTWVTEYCRPQQRTVMLAHNLGHDLRISAILKILPTLGWELEWCNLDRNVSSMTWRSKNGTLVLADTWTWLPMPLATVAPSVGLTKLQLPPDKATHYQWEQYCMRDAEIVYRVASQLIEYIGTENLGNWQPTGAGMAYATWRHKFMTHRVLVHDDATVLAAERRAMHTGRAEAWRHGVLEGTQWTEIDMKNAYVRIAAECDLPTKLRFRTGAINVTQYRKLCEYSRVLCWCDVHTTVEAVPHFDGTRTLWPVGHFQDWYWDTELDCLLESGATVKIVDGYAYTRAPILQKWAKWVLAILHGEIEGASPVVQTWIKHCSRALIGRISLKAPKWEYFGENPDQQTGITHMLDVELGHDVRLMHVGNQTFVETQRTEGRDSLPQVTGWIMAECRKRLWRAMLTAGLDEIAHVDTDSLLISREGVRRLREYWGKDFRTYWQAKGTWRRLVIYGPRNYRRGRARVVAGVPRKAREVLPNHFKGERWSGLAADLEAGRAASVQVVADTWTLTPNDPRRRDTPGADGRTRPYQVDAGAASSVSSSSRLG